MQLMILYLFLSFVGYISAWDKNDLKNFGPLNIVLNNLKCDHNKNLNLDVSKTEVYFYDFENHFMQSFPVNTAAQGILSLIKHNEEKKLYMFVGGFKSNTNKRTEERVIEVFKNVRNSYLIVIDHSAYTHNGQNNNDITSLSLFYYRRSAKYVYYIGKQLAQMLAKLQEGGISAKNIHCIGHSLGSQILGHTGENFIKATRQKISRITALDPAGPGFSNNLREEQVRSGVADYVEVYHCNAHALGTSSVLGDIDFFINNGQSQPNCGSSIFSIAAKCSHKMCVTLWIASVAHSDWYPSYKCNDYKAFKCGNCSENDRTTAGFWNPGSATGVYYFSTKYLNLSYI